jgi:hypothetical protein
MHILTPLNYILLYILMGTLWGTFIDYMDKQTNSSKLPRTFTAMMVVIITWPFMLILFVFTFIKNLLK